MLEPGTKTHHQVNRHCSHGAARNKQQTEGASPLLLQPSSLPAQHPTLAEPSGEPAGKGGREFAESQRHKAAYRRVGMGLGDNSWTTHTLPSYKEKLVPCLGLWLTS